MSVLLNTVKPINIGISRNKMLNTEVPPSTDTTTGKPNASLNMLPGNTYGKYIAFKGLPPEDKPMLLYPPEIPKGASNEKLKQIIAENQDYVNQVAIDRATAKKILSGFLKYAPIPDKNDFGITAAKQFRGIGDENKTNVFAKVLLDHSTWEAFGGFAPNRDRFIKIVTVDVLEAMRELQPRDYEKQGVHAKRNYIAGYITAVSSYVDNNALNKPWGLYGKLKDTKTMDPEMILYNGAKFLYEGSIDEKNALLNVRAMCKEYPGEVTSLTHMSNAQFDRSWYPRSLPSEYDNSMKTPDTKDTDWPDYDDFDDKVSHAERMYRLYGD